MGYLKVGDNKEHTIFLIGNHMVAECDNSFIILFPDGVWESTNEKHFVNFEWKDGSKTYYHAYSVDKFIEEDWGSNVMKVARTEKHIIDYTKEVLEYFEDNLPDSLFDITIH